jgi:hypothetical protein
MRKFYDTALLLLAVLSAGYLFIYGRELVRMSAMNEWEVHFEWLDEVSIWFYRERDDATGQPASPYYLSRHLSIVDPLDGPNWEVRIPGWMPAIPALGIVILTAFTFYGSREPRVA